MRRRRCARFAVQLVAGVPLAAVDSPSDAIVSTRHGQRWDIRLRDTSVIPDRDFVLGWQPKPQTQPNVASFSQDIDGAVDDPNRLMQLIDQQLGDSRLFTIGIGSAPNAGFVAAAARHGRGSEILIADGAALAWWMQRTPR